MRQICVLPGKQCGIAADKLATKAHEGLAVDWNTAQRVLMDLTVIEYQCFEGAGIEGRVQPVLFLVLGLVAVAPTVLRAV